MCPFSDEYLLALLTASACHETKLHFYHRGASCEMKTWSELTVSCNWSDYPFHWGGERSGEMSYGAYPK